jgi:hypothetical protein
MQIVIAESTAVDDRDKVGLLQPLFPKIAKHEVEYEARDGLYQTVTGLGDQRQAWTQILDTLNAKIPKGVWITELIPSWVDASPEPARQGRPAVGGPGQYNMLEISGLYHSNPLTESIQGSVIDNFVITLADSPLFVIDKNNLTATLPTVETEANGAFALHFTMHLRLKTPILIRADVPAAPTPGHP